MPMLRAPSSPQRDARTYNGLEWWPLLVLPLSVTNEVSVMRFAAPFVTLVVSSLIASSSAAPAASATTPTIEQCAALLPPGKRYEFSVSGTIDYTGAKPVLHGDLSVGDETHDDLRQQAGPFAQCFARLVR